MILIKKADSQKYKILKSNFIESTFIATFENDKTTFDTDDLNLINYVNANFEDYVETELRLDALEGLIVGEQSMFSKIRAKVGL